MAVRPDRLGTIAFAPNGTLYEVAAVLGLRGPAAPRLVTINPANAAILSSVNLSEFFGALAVRQSDGALFGSTGDDHEIFRIDPATGSLTFVGDTGKNFVGALAFGPPPARLPPTRVNRPTSTRNVPFPTPSRLIGANISDLFLSYLGISPGGVAGARHAMDEARARGFTHVHFIASGYWPVDMTTGKGWLADPLAYFAAFDALIADARARGLGLVPSLLWNLYLFPDLAGEPAGKLFTPGTGARLLAERYVTEVVTRYRGEPAILFWELGNELDLLADVDVSGCNVCASAANACAALAPSLGTPCSRSSADNFFSCNSCRGDSSRQQDLGEFAAAIASLIYALDPRHSFEAVTIAWEP